MNLQAIAAVALYACLNTLVLLWLQIAISRLRHRHHVLIGNGGVKHLERTMRGQANAVENMPMMLVLMTLAALLGAPATLLHALGIVFTAGRTIHAWHFIQENGAKWERAAGFGLSMLAQLAAVAALLGYAVSSLV